MRVGLLGTGAVGQLHANAATDLEHVRISAVCSLALEEARKVAAPHGASVHSDHRELLAQDLDAVIISTPHALHTAMVLDAAAAGVHVLVEKPMATTVEDCDAMISACEAAGVVLAVGHIQHFLPDQVAAHKAVQDGHIGRPLMVHEYRSTDYRPGTRPQWFLDPAIAGGGAVMNIGSHGIDRSSWLVDSLPAAVDAAATWSRFGVGVETDAMAHLRMANDVRVSLTVTSTTPVPFNEVTVVGQEGTIVAAPRRGTLLRSGDTENVLHEPASGDIPRAFRSQLRAFADLVAHGTTFPVSTALSRAVIETVLGIYRSAETQRPFLLGAEAQSVRAQ